MEFCEHSIIAYGNPSLFNLNQTIFACKKNKFMFVFTRRGDCPIDCRHFKIKEKIKCMLKS